METILLHTTIIIYLLSLTASAIMILRRQDCWERCSRTAIYAGLLGHSATIIARTVHAQRLPFSNLYETLLVFSWGIAVICALIIKKRGYTAINAVTLPTVCAALLYAAQLDSTIRPLPPALHSSWLFFHVSLAIISYGAFAVAGGLGVLYLVLNRKLHKDSALPPYLPQPDKIDNLILATISLAFPCLVLVILTGAIWAQQAWGSYWSWDPKETWALITALIYAAFLYTRLHWQWRGKSSAWFAIIGFLVVIFCYLGVNLLLGGLHSYATP